MGVAHTCCNVCSKMAAISADALDDDWWREEDEEAADSRKRKESSDTTSIKKKRKTITQKLRTERVRIHFLLLTRLYVPLMHNTDSVLCYQPLVE